MFGDSIDGSAGGPPKRQNPTRGEHEERSMGKETVKAECDIKEQAGSSHAGLHGVVGSVEK
jgi:hypothetical protein